MEDKYIRDQIRNATGWIRYGIEIEDEYTIEMQDCEEFKSKYQILIRNGTLKYGMQIGVSLLIALMVFVTILDISRL